MSFLVSYDVLSSCVHAQSMCTGVVLGCRAVCRAGSCPRENHVPCYFCHYTVAKSCISSRLRLAGRNRRMENILQTDDLYSHKIWSIIWVTEQRNMTWMGHVRVTRSDLMRNTCNILAGKPQGRYCFVDLDVCG